MANSPEQQCPRCHGTTGYAETVILSGRRTYLREWDGEADHADTDEERERVPKFVRCRDCGKQVRNPNHD